MFRCVSMLVCVLSCMPCRGVSVGVCEWVGVCVDMCAMLECKCLGV